MRTAIYPGTFDPLTNGHLDVVQRAAKLFDRVVVAVAKNDYKHPLFTLDERFALVKQAVRNLPRVEVDTFDSLLVEYVMSRKAQAIVRGLRAVSDFEFEFQLALMNRKLNENIETIFMMPKDTYTFLSSQHREGNRAVGRRRERVCAAARADRSGEKVQRRKKDLNGACHAADCQSASRGGA